jgi:hypothetical protein
MHHDIMLSSMRTPLQIDDDRYQAAKNMASAKNQTVGEVVSALLRKALHPLDYPEPGADLPSFRVSETAPLLTVEMVHEADEDIA